MIQEKRREIILRQTVEAMSRVGRGRSQVDDRRDQPPRPGDVFTLKRTADFEVVWAVIGWQNEAPQRLIVIPADLHPTVGPWDVGVTADSDQSALTLRCRCRLLVEESELDVEERSCVLAPSIVKVIEARMLEILDAERSGKMQQWEAEAEPEVLFAEKRARRAMSVLIA